MTVVTRPAFADALRELVDSSGMSQVKFAFVANYDHSYLSRLISGTRTPTREFIRNVADSLECTDIQRDRLLVSAGFAPEGRTMRDVIDLCLWGDRR